MTAGSAPRAPVEAGAPTITAGAYLCLRRTSAGVPIGDAARALVGHDDPDQVNTAEVILDDAERDLIHFEEAAIRRLQTVFPIDALVYGALAQGDMRVRSVCRGCGCSDWDPCATEIPNVGCSWADAGKTLCTVCQARGIAA